MTLHIPTASTGAGRRPAPPAPDTPTRQSADAKLLSGVEQTMLGLIRTTSTSAAHRAALHHLRAGGGRFRARLSIDAGLALGIDPADIQAVAAAVELVHNASLIHDDLQDRDETRRDSKAVWTEFGEAVAISAGDLLLSAAYAALASSGPATAGLIELLHRRISRLIEGQDADLTTAHRHVDLAGYEAIAAGKSGPLLILPLEMCLTLADFRDERTIAADCGRHFAVGYQMFDDLRDVADDRSRNALNAVAVVAATGSVHPEARVTELAVAHFRQARQLSDRLPALCGRMIAQSAHTLSRQLTGETGTWSD